jgi:uncharacterized paraquat-inducible protein A
MKLHCKKCQKITKHKKSTMGTRCTNCHELNYDYYTAQIEQTKREIPKKYLELSGEY